MTVSAFCSSRFASLTCPQKSVFSVALITSLAIAVISALVLGGLYSSTLQPVSQAFSFMATPQGASIGLGLGVALGLASFLLIVIRNPKKLPQVNIESSTVVPAEQSPDSDVSATSEKSASELPTPPSHTIDAQNAEKGLFAIYELGLRVTKYLPLSVLGRLELASKTCYYTVNDQRVWTKFAKRSGLISNLNPSLRWNKDCVLLVNGVHYKANRQLETFLQKSPQLEIFLQKSQETSDVRLEICADTSKLFFSNHYCEKPVDYRFRVLGNVGDVRGEEPRAIEVSFHNTECTILVHTEQHNITTTVKLEKSTLVHADLSYQNYCRRPGFDYFLDSHFQEKTSLWFVYQGGTFDTINIGCKDLIHHVIRLSVQNETHSRYQRFQFVATSNKIIGFSRNGVILACEKPLRLIGERITGRIIEHPTTLFDRGSFSLINDHFVNCVATDQDVCLFSSRGSIWQLMPEIGKWAMLSNSCEGWQFPTIWKDRFLILVAQEHIRVWDLKTHKELRARSLLGKPYAKASGLCVHGDLLLMPHIESSSWGRTSMQIAIWNLAQWSQSDSSEYVTRCNLEPNTYPTWSMDPKQFSIHVSGGFVWIVGRSDAFTFKMCGINLFSQLPFQHVETI